MDELIPDVGDSVLVRCEVKEVIRSIVGIRYRVTPPNTTFIDMVVESKLVTKIPKVRE